MNLWKLQVTEQI